MEEYLLNCFAFPDYPGAVNGRITKPTIRQTPFVVKSIQSISKPENDLMEQLLKFLDNISVYQIFDLETDNPNKRMVEETFIIQNSDGETQEVELQVIERMRDRRSENDIAVFELREQIKESQNEFGIHYSKRIFFFIDQTVHPQEKIFKAKILVTYLAKEKMNDERANRATNDRIEKTRKVAEAFQLDRALYFSYYSCPIPIVNLN